HGGLRQAHRDPHLDRADRARAEDAARSLVAVDGERRAVAGRGREADRRPGMEPRLDHPREHAHARARAAGHRRRRHRARRRRAADRARDRAPGGVARAAVAPPAGARGGRRLSAPPATVARSLSSLAVFCGSSSGNDPRHAEGARDFGRLLAEHGIAIVYGGGRVGLMGALADAALAAGGRVVGVIPEALVARELAHPGLSELRVVASMHERKATMAELADAFVALPGGIGTLEELFEVWTWGQLGLHRKACGLLDLHGYYTSLL